MPEFKPTSETSELSKDSKNNLFLIFGLLIFAIIALIIFDLFEEEPNRKINQTTSSAKQATSSENSNVVDQWSTYNGTFIQVSFKVPPTWVVKEDEGIKVGNKLVNSSISVSDSQRGRNWQITTNFLGGFASLVEVNSKKVNIDGIETNQSFYKVETSASNEPTSFAIELEKKRGEETIKYLITGSFSEKDEAALRIFDLIHSTLDLK